LFAATILGFPTLIQEQNSFPGVTTRLLSRWVDRIHISFEASRRYFARPDKLVLSGNPVRLFEFKRTVADSRRLFQLSPDQDTLLVFGGSQGAEMLNQTLAACLPKIMKETFLQVLWSTGENNLATVLQSVGHLSGRVRVFKFIEDMESAYRAATFCVARAGALTCAEIAVCGLPAILVPYPFAAANHQEINALAIQQKGGADVILQNHLTPELLAERIIEMAQNTGKRNEMAEASKRLAFPRATRDLVMSIQELAGGQKNE
ncbi:MAG: UDP-N-acetylglucosamine--N-acetylmuramyl-(pentapeptide) pyrophosphoryl-undecaprenol N-acetylglucosamine transferase, partial [Calditrichaeota bacterium]